MIYAYCRVSTKNQKLPRQYDLIEAEATEQGYTVDEWYSEKFTGTTQDRKEWDKLKGKAGKGDVIIFESVSRMSRNEIDGVNDYFELYDKGVELRFIREPGINTEVYRKATEKHYNTINSDNALTPPDKLTKAIMEAIKEYEKDIATEQIKLAFRQAEKEARDIRARVKGGIAQAQKQNKLKGLNPGDEGYIQIGRQEGEIIPTEKSIKAKKIIRKQYKKYGGNNTATEVMKIAEITRGTFYRYVAELEAEAGAL